MTTTKEYFDHKKALLAREREGMDMLDKLVLPLMPHTLEECFEPSYLSCYGTPLTALRIDFFRKQDAEVDRAHGTVAKVTEALAKDGWVSSAPPDVKLYSKSGIQVQLEVAKDIKDDLSAFARSVSLTVTFENLAPTDNCRLVEEEVEIPAVEAHTAVKMKLVCDEEESDDDNANVG